MKTLSAILFTLNLAFLTVSSSGQKAQQKIIQVLKKEVIDSVFVFGKWTGKGETETHLKYLG